MFKEKIQKIYEHCRKNNLPHVEREIDGIVSDSLNGRVNEAEMARRLQDVLDSNGIMSKSLNIVCEKQYVKSANDVKNFTKRYRKISPKIYETFKQIVSDSTCLVGNTRIFDNLSMKKINHGISLIEESYRKMVKESLESSSVNIQEGEILFDEYIDFEFYFSEEYVERNEYYFKSLMQFFQEGMKIWINVHSGDTDTGYVCQVEFIDVTPDDFTEIERIIKDYHETYTDILITEDDEEFIDDLLLSDVEPGKYIVVESPVKHVSEFDEIMVISTDETSVMITVNKKSLKLHKDIARKIVVISDEELEEIFECEELHTIVNSNYNICQDFKYRLYSRGDMSLFVDRMTVAGDSYKFEDGSHLFYEDGKYILEYVDQYGDTVREIKSFDFVILTAINSLSYSSKEYPSGVKCINVKSHDGKTIDLSSFYQLASDAIKDDEMRNNFFVEYQDILNCGNISYDFHDYVYGKIVDLAINYNVADILQQCTANDEEFFREAEKSILREEVIAKLMDVIPEPYDKFDVIIDEEAVREFCSFTTSEWFHEQDVDNYVNFVVSFLEKRGFDMSMYR